MKGHQERKLEKGSQTHLKFSFLFLQDKGFAQI